MRAEIIALTLGSRFQQPQLPRLAHYRIAQVKEYMEEIMNISLKEAADFHIQ